MSITNYIKSQQQSKYLTKTTFINQIKDKEFRALLTKLYNQPQRHLNVMGTILNAIYTEGKTTFYISKRSLEKLIAQDKSNLEYKQRTGIKLGKKPSIIIGHILKEIIEACSSQKMNWNVLRVCKPYEFDPTTIELICEHTLNLMDKSNQLTINLRSIVRQSCINLWSISSQCTDSDNNNIELEENDYPIDSINSIDSTNPIDPKGKIPSGGKLLESEDFKKKEDNTIPDLPESDILTPEKVKQIDSDMLALVGTL